MPQKAVHFGMKVKEHLSVEKGKKASKEQSGSENKSSVF